MKIYLLDYYPAFNTINFNENQDYECIREQVKDGRPISTSWQPYSVSLEDNNKPTDFLYRVGGGLIVSAKAKEVLSNSLMNVEFLPLDSDIECYLLNVCNILDCIDVENSKEKSFRYEELSFFEEKLKGQDVFRVKAPSSEYIHNEIYVSEELKEKIESNLVGFQLIEVWDSNFTWKQKEEQFLFMCTEINRSLVEKFNFEAAIKFVKSNKGKQSYSGKWSLKVDDDNDMLLGQLQLDGTYKWIVPVFYPPIILGLEWGV